MELKKTKEGERNNNREREQELERKERENNRNRKKCRTTELEIEREGKRERERKRERKFIAPISWLSRQLLSVARLRELKDTGSLFYVLQMSSEKKKRVFGAKIRRE